MRHNEFLRLPDPINTCLQLLIPMLAKEIPHHCLQFRLLISVHIKYTPLLQILQVEVVLVLFFQLVELSAISNPFHSLEVFVLKSYVLHIMIYSGHFLTVFVLSTFNRVNCHPPYALGLVVHARPFGGKLNPPVFPFPRLFHLQPPKFLFKI